VLFRQLLQRPECHWLSATNGDNAYGSEVVQRILSAPPLQIHANATTSSATAAPSFVLPDMLLSPLDSAELANHGTLTITFTTSKFYNFADIFLPVFQQTPKIHKIRLQAERGDELEQALRGHGDDDLALPAVLLRAASPQGGQRAGPSRVLQGRQAGRRATASRYVLI